MIVGAIMLDPSRIVHLKLDRWRMAAHTALPQPRHVSKPLTGQFTAISGSVLTSVLGVSPEVFGAQLEHARCYGAEYLCTIDGDKIAGISVATSLIKHGDVMCKNMIVPAGVLTPHSGVDERIIIGAFVRGGVKDGYLNFDGQVEVLGWANTTDIKMSPSQAAPSTFVTKLKRILAIPCSELRPIDELIPRLGGNQMITKQEEG
jgi:hypothetical protein